MALFINVDLEKPLLDALVYICKKYVPDSEILIHENHKGISVKVPGGTKYIFFGDSKVTISEKSDKGLANTMREEDVA
jgi:hypothetical protein